ncbi:MAG: efflux RND transporter periplasmic adaptor subunit [Bryobacteraceae bacterium]|jgi:membrane fusion protein, multidrug efflux system
MSQDHPSALDPAAPPDTRTKHAPTLPRHDAGEASKRSGHGWIWLLLLVLVAAGAYYFWSKKSVATGTNGSGGAGGAQKKGFGAIPVVTAKARKGNIPVYLVNLGGVLPIYTVTVRSRVDGQLMEVHYKEGDIVQKGSPLIEIDSRPYDAALVQAEGQLIRDQALLDNAKIDLARYKTLVTQNAVPEQQVATQEALVKQDEGIVKTDQGMIDTAKLNVVYSHITSPITGRVGLRLVDPGNIVHAADTNGMLVITQLDPISVLFPLPEDQVPVVLQKLNAGQKLPVDAFDRSSDVILAHGTLATVDNEIDPTTGSLRWRANFANPNYKLFPGQFVNVRVLVQLKQGVTLAPTATIQRNSQSTYVYLVKPDSSVTVRTVQIGTVEGNDSEITSGLQPGDQIVMTGVDKLQEGTKVAPHLAADTGTGAAGASRSGSAPSSGGAPAKGTPTGSGKPGHGSGTHKAS